MEGRARIRIVDDLGGLELIEAAFPRPHFARHAHPTYALGVVHSGANRFRYRGAFHTARAGALCTVTPDEVHTVEPAGAAGFAYRCLYPPAELVRSAAEGLGGRRLRRTLLLPPVIEDAETAGMAAGLFDAIAAGVPRLARETALAVLLARVVTRHAIAPVLPCRIAAPEGAVARARDFLAAHGQRQVALAELATVAGMEPFSLLRAFGRAYGLPPHAWLVQQRVRRAQALLRAGKPPGEVAAEVGFADQSHLTRHFKRLTGVTPGAYRRDRTSGTG